MKRKSILFIKTFLFFILFISVFSVICLGADGGYPSDSDITSDKLGYLYKKVENGKSGGGTIVQMDTKVKELKNDYAEKMQKACKNNFEGLDFITNVKVKGNYFVFSTDDNGNIVATDTVFEKEYPITEIDLSFLDYYTGSAEFTITFKVKDTEYFIKTSTKNGWDGTNKYSRASSSEDSEKAKAKRAENAGLMLSTLSDAAYTGIIAGSVGAGFNVGTVYSNRQVALSAVTYKVDSAGSQVESTEEESDEVTVNTSYGRHNDFKDLSYVKYSFSYYISPLFGKMDAVEYADVFGESQDTKWVEIARNMETKAIDGKTINISDEFKDFSSRLSEDKMTEDGYKISNKKLNGNGAQKFKGVHSSETPRTVLSYNIRIAYPYAFTKSGSLYSMSTNNLRVDGDYTFNVFNEKFYKTSTFEEVANRAEIPNLGMEDMFLYRQKIDGNFVGVIIIGNFLEAVIDTSSKGDATLYATGRQIGFNNGYSSQLNLNHANKEMMYCVGDSGLTGFLPKNAAFSLSKDELDIIENNMNAMGEAENQGKSQIKSLPIKSNEDIEKDLVDINNHPYIAESPTGFKFYILFTEVENKKALSDLKEKAEEGGEGGEGDENNAKDFKQWAFCIIRNNRYVNDNSLTSWLRTDKAKSIPYVDSETLLNKITGNYIDGFVKLTYEDWKKMKSIESELNTNKSMFLVRIMNTMSIVMGVFLIIFAILICLAYWIDIFNTFTDFSILQFISSGRLYPIESEHLGDIVNKKSETTKYVTFKEVLVIAGIMVVIGVIFMNVSYVVYLISCLYNYILDTIGGV